MSSATASSAAPPGPVGSVFSTPYVSLPDFSGAERAEIYNVPPIPIPPGVLWMPPLPPIPSCPPGLEYLTLVDQIMIRQQIEVLELITCCETRNKYEIKNTLRQNVYFAIEQNGCCTLNFCGSCRPFTMEIFDNMERQVMYIIRPCRCWCCCCFCCLQELEVHAPPGRPIGYVKQIWDPCVPAFAIQNEARKNVLKIFGPCIGCGCCSNIPFDVTSVDEQHTVGKITKHCAGFVKEFFTDTDYFGVQFPMDLDVKIKAVLLGACFLIDFMFFEDNEPVCLSRNFALIPRAPVYPGPGFPTQYAGRPPFPGASRPAPYHYGGHPGPYGVPPVPGQPPGPYHAMWMPAPPAIRNCPPGLEYLTQIDQIIIHQQLEVLELIFGFETNNKYEIKNAMGQRVYFAAEDNDCCTLCCCGPLRPFSMKIFDNMGQEVIELHRPFRCDCCCCPCCLQELEVHAPPGIPIGYVKQLWHPCLPEFVIQNEVRQDVLKIIGPCIVCSCFGDVNFEVLSLDEQQVIGRIGKHWTGLLKEFFTDVDNFGIQFPMDLDVKMKAVMLGAAFLIDYMFFEATGQSQGQSMGVWQM